MTAAEFHKRLAGRISDNEADALRRGEGLYISAFNRSVCLRLLETGSSDDRSVSPEQAEALEAELRDYLNEYMPDRPEGHKWIILACLTLAFLEGRPMHPQTAAGWVERDGRYFCPHMVPDSVICRCCACEPMEPDPREEAPPEALC